MECGLSDSFSNTVKLLPKSSTLYTKQPNRNTHLDCVNITPNVSEKLAKASDEFPTEQSLKPQDCSNQHNSNVGNWDSQVILGKVASSHNYPRPLVSDNEGTVSTANSVTKLSQRLVEKADVSRKVSGPPSMVESSMMIDENNRFNE